MESTTKRDFLIDLEKEAQAKWSEQKLFEQNSPFATGEVPIPENSGDVAKAAQAAREKYPKWFGNFPYPYMNGVLHLGHAFSASKIEFATGFERMLGKRALWPFGFHCTGLPIKASADKLVREIEMFGPDFSGFREEDADEGEKSEKFKSDDKSKSVRSKAEAKTGGFKYQFQIMLAAGIPREEIHKFANTDYWLSYFPPIAQDDMTRMGARVDWRRSFITTDANPYYDSFVRWQMNKLHKEGKVKFGKRYTIFSVKDNQPCMDHDRSSGEGVGPQQYYGVKMTAVNWGEKVPEDIRKLKNVHLLAASLRPETMYGQTNCFIGPTVDYVVVKGKNDDYYLVTERAASNMAYQGLLAEDDKVDVVAHVKGSDLVGTEVSAPYSEYKTVFVVPMNSVNSSKGTAVVTCVTSDSPDDYITIEDLKKKADYYGIKAEWVSKEPVSVIKSETYGDFTAKTLVEKMKIQSPKDAQLLAEAKGIAYKDGFYSGLMNCGPYKGKSVNDAKPLVGNDLVKDGLAVMYSEPEAQVVSRSGDSCIVALTDQWYLDYGEPSWRAITEKELAQLDTHGEEVRHDFEKTLAWLHEWACARSYGLGSKLPWDPQFLVESLTDSTIYMSYYTVANMLHGNPPLNGSHAGPLGITAEDMTDEMWEYVLIDGPFPKDSKVPEEKARQLKAEFNYFYPFDLRSSGKDLIPNHLTLSLYTHSAVFPPEHWPRGFRANGHLLLNGEKMSKSKGNTLSLREGIEKFGADAMRIGLADAGDSIEDANFDESVANAAIKRLQNFVVWSKEQLGELGQLRRGNNTNIWDDIFTNEMNQIVQDTYTAYNELMYKDALRNALYLLITAKDSYQNACVFADGLHADLVTRYIELQCLLLAPIAPHTVEHVWSDLLKKDHSIQNARWPEAGPVDPVIAEKANFARNTVQRIRDAELSFVRRKAKKGEAVPTYDPSKPKAIALFVSRNYPEWQDFAVETIQKFWDPETRRTDDENMRKYLIEKGVLKDKKTMPFISAFRPKVAQFGERMFDRSVAFDQAALLKSILPYMQKNLDIENINVYEAANADPSTPGYDARIIESAEPYSPAIIFYNTA